MKKILVSVVLVVLLIGLVACGGNGNTLVAKKESTNDGFKVKEEIEIAFNDEAVSEIKYSYKFESSEKAQFYYSLGAEDESYFLKDVSLNGSKMTGVLKDISEFDGMNKEAVKKAFEEKGYKVK